MVSQQFTAFTIPTAVIFFATIALAAGLDAPPLESRRSYAGMAGALPLLYLAARFMFADHALALAQGSLAAGHVAAAELHYASSRMPGASSDLWYSRALINARAFPQALAAGVRATETAEDPFNAWYSLSAIYAAQNDPVHAELALRAAIGANPTWFKPHWTLARLLALTGRPQDGEREAAIAVDLDGGKHGEVSRTLVDLRTQLQK